MLVPINSFEVWLENKGLKERTVQNYIYYFNKFTSPKFNQESISKFLSFKGHRNSIARSFLINLKGFMLMNSEELKIDPYYYKEINDVILPKITGRTSERLVKTLTEKQIWLLEKTLDTEELKIMLLTTYYAGLRLGELMKIKINSFNWPSWKKDLKAMGEVKVFGKGDKEGIAILPAFIMVRISKFIRDKADRFLSVDAKLFCIGSSSFQKHLNKAGILSGITQRKPNGEFIEETRVHPHKLRHSYAHNLLIKGTDIMFIKEALRHSSIQSTQIYTQLNKEELKKAIGSVLNKPSDKSSSK